MFFPAGLPEDSETHWEHGIWVEIRAGKFFVPNEGANGHTMDELVEEVLAMRTGGEKAQTTAADVSAWTAKVAAGSVLTAATCGMAPGFAK